MGEVQAAAQVRTTLNEPSLRLLVDAVRGVLVISGADSAAQQRYMEHRAALQERTGWQLELAQTTREERVQTEARQALAAIGLRVAKIHLHPDEQRVVVVVQGTCKLPALVATQATFTEQTGWALELEHA